MRHWQQILMAIDQMANVLLGGYADETLSARASHRMIGDSQVGEMQDGKQVMGTLIRNCGPHYEVYHLKDLGNKVQRTRFGYKIGNAMGNDPELTRAMVVGIGFSYKRKKK